MQEDSIRDEIVALEARIERLKGEIERCRKISLAARIAVAGGLAWFALLLLWILPFDPTFFVAALAATLGGVVLLGSNSTTWEQTEEKLHATEEERAELIGRIALRVVHDAPPTLH
jgi:hypothetical protein